MTTVSDLKNKFGFSTEHINQHSVDDLHDRAIGAYLGLAIGDALGATTEFLTASEIQNKFGLHNKIIGGGWLKLKAGQVTDDTEMSLALGNSILKNKGVEAESVAEAFSEWMRSKPIDIGHTVRQGIVHYRTTGNAQVQSNEFGAGNGACMRSLPIALFYHNKSITEMIQASRVQSHITHNNKVADAGTETVLLMLRSALQAEPKSVLQQHADKLVSLHRAYRYDRRQITNPSGWIVETLQVVFQSFFAAESFSDILVDIVNRGGDADTTGAIGGMLAGALYGASSIPDYWLKALDRKVFNDCSQQALELVGR